MSIFVPGTGLQLAAAAALALCGLSGLAEDAPAAKPDARPEAKSDARLPVPPAAAQNEQRGQIRKLLEDEYKTKDASERSALAKRLLKLAQESKNDALTYYVALCESRDVAVSAGDVEAAFEAIDALAGAFVAEPNELRASALSTVARSVTSAEAA